MQHRTESKTSPRRIDAIFKQRQALELRMAGRNYYEIADALGYSGHTSALAAVNKALEKTLEEPSQRYRSMTLERLTKVLQVHWPAMLARDDAATRHVLNALKDIRQLMGLDAPQRLEHSGPEGGPIQQQVVTLDFGDVTEALQVLADAGAIRMDPNGHGLNGSVDAIHPTPADR
jgi:hypothetical protein